MFTQASKRTQATLSATLPARKGAAGTFVTPSTHGRRQLAGARVDPRAAQLGSWEGNIGLHSAGSHEYAWGQLASACICPRAAKSGSCWQGIGQRVASLQAQSYIIGLQRLCGEKLQNRQQKLGT